MSDRRISRRKFLKLSTAALAVTTVGFQLPSRSRLVVERHTLSLPRWSADGFKIAFLSDFHLDDEGAATRSIHAIELAAAEKPDVIAFGGDFVSGRSELGSFPLVEKVFKRLADTGITSVGVPGNHDYWQSSEQIQTLFETTTKAGLKLLRNQHIEFQGIVINGIDDGFNRLDRHDSLPRRFDKNILTLFHEPDFVTRIDKRASLMLAGHSHGGQICLPFGLKVHTPVGARDYWSGFYESATVPLYVSRGVGTVGPDLRAFLPTRSLNPHPQIFLIKIFRNSTG